MKFSLFLILILINGCSNKASKSIAPDGTKMSTAQAFLSDLKDSVITQYRTAGTEEKKHEILNKYSRQLLEFLMRNPMDSMRVTMDSVRVSGFTVWTQSHFGSIEFGGRLTFEANMPPRPDSVFQFMKSLKPGSDVVVRLGYLGTARINNPDSARSPTFKIYAYPSPLR